MKRSLLFFAALLCFAFAFAEPARAGAIRWGITTVVGLPNPCEPEGHGYIIIDANPDCDTGGGTEHKICFCDSAGTGYNTLSINAAEILDQNAGTDITADLEEEAQVGLSNATGNAAANTAPIGTGVNAFSWNVLPAGGTNGCEGAADKPTYNATTNSWGCGTDSGVTPKFSYSWPAWNMNVDGTQCEDISQREIVTGGARVSTIRCADDAAAEIQFNVQSQDYAGGTLVFQVSAINENATPTGNLVFDVQAACRGDGDLHNSTWGTLQTATIGFDTQDDEELAATSAVTPDGTCAADDHIYVRMLVNAGSTTTEMPDTRVVQVSMLEQ